MGKVLHIERPEIEGERKLKPLELNSFRVGHRHTVITPDRLRKIK